MSKLKAKSLIKIFIILLIYRSVATDRQGLFNVGYWDKYFCGIAICIILFIAIAAKNSFRIPISYGTKKIFFWLITPIITAWIYSVFINVIMPVEYHGFISRSFGNVMYGILAILQGFLMYEYFKGEAVDITFWAYTFGFITSVIVAFMQGGITQFSSMLFDSTYNGSVLEMSELLPAIGLFLIYYLYRYRYRYTGLNKKQIALRIFICILTLIVGMKRILILSSALVILIYFLLKKRTGKIKVWSGVIAIMFIAIIYLYIYGIRSGIMFDLFRKYNINTMARTQLWSAISNAYFFSPLYFGRGLGFTTKWMDNNWNTIGIVGLTGTTGLHNDLLKYFIDLGFWGFGLYLFSYLNIITVKIANLLDGKSAFVYFLLMIFQILCWFTDNVSGFHIFMWPFYLIVFSLINDVKAGLEYE